MLHNKPTDRNSSANKPQQLLRSNANVVYPTLISFTSINHLSHYGENVCASIFEYVCLLCLSFVNRTTPICCSLAGKAAQQPPGPPRADAAAPPGALRGTRRLPPQFPIVAHQGRPRRGPHRDASWWQPCQQRQGQLPRQSGWQHYYVPQGEVLPCLSKFNTAHPSVNAVYAFYLVDSVYS